MDLWFVIWWMLLFVYLADEIQMQDWSDCVILQGYSNWFYYHLCFFKNLKDSFKFMLMKTSARLSDMFECMHKSNFLFPFISVKFFQSQGILGSCREGENIAERQSPHVSNFVVKLLLFILHLASPIFYLSWHL